MPKEAGLNVRFHIGNAASPEVFSNVPAENVQINLQSAEIDVSDNESSGWGATLAGRRNVTVTLSGPFNEDHVNHALLKTKWFAQAKFNARVIQGTGGDYFAGQFIVNTLTFGGSVDQAKTFQATINSFEAISETIV